MSGKPNSRVGYNYITVGDNDHANFEIKLHYLPADLLTILDSKTIDAPDRPQPKS